MSSNQPPAPGRPHAQYIPPNANNFVLGFPGNNIFLQDRIVGLNRAQYLTMMQSNLIQNNPNHAMPLQQNYYTNTLIDFPNFETILPPSRPPQAPHPAPQPIPISISSTASSEHSPEPAPFELSKERAEQIFRSSLSRLRADGADLLDLQYWIDFAAECFSDEACYRHQYLSDSRANHDFSADFDLLPFMLRMPYACGALGIRFSLDRPTFISQDGLHQLSYACCLMFTDYPSACVKSTSSLTVTFESDGKMLAWDFTTFDNEELISRPPVSANPPLSLAALEGHSKPKSKRLLQRLQVTPLISPSKFQMMRDVTTVLTLVGNMDSVPVDSCKPSPTTYLISLQPTTRTSPNPLNTPLPGSCRPMSV